MKKLLILILLLLPTTLSAQTFYDHTPNARVAAMGGASVAMRADAFAAFGNAAAVPMEYKSVQAAFSYVNFSGNIYRKNRMLSGGAYARFAQRHALMVGLQFNLEPQNIEDRRPGAQLFNLGYGYKLSDRLSLAVTARYRRTYGNIDDSANISGGGADLALFSRLPMHFLEGAALNIGGKLSFDTPASLRYDRYTFAPTVGVALSMPFSDAHLLDITAEAKYGITKQNDIFVARLGAEYSLMRLFYFRAGGNVACVTESLTIPYASIGAGVRFFHLQFDIAYLIGKKNTPFNNAVQVNFGLDF